MVTKELEIGSFTDERDSQEYKTVRMPDGKIWMAQNLNYEIENSWRYPNDEYIGKTYGRLYTWDAAMKACPTGWRLPSKFDWINLGIALGCSFGGWMSFPIKKLLAKNGWKDSGTDDFGFSALPGGFRNEDGIPFGLGIGCLWWLCTMSLGDGYADTILMNEIICEINNLSRVGQGCSVRCIQ